MPDLDKLRYVFDAVASIRRALNGRVPLIGFSGSPWTLACYMVEGAGSDDYRRVKTMLYARPDLLHRILDINARTIAAYLDAQIDAGAQAVMIFDSWGGVLADSAFRRFSLDYTRRVLDSIARSKDDVRIPALVFTKGGGMWLEAIAATGCDVVGVDWTVDLGQARRRVGDAVALQGNLDPAVLFAPPQAIRAEVDAVLRSFGDEAIGLISCSPYTADFQNESNKRFIAAMEHWRSFFLAGADQPVIGASEADLRSIRVPACVVPGNDRIHARRGGENVGRLIPGAEVHDIMPPGPDLEEIPFAEWDRREPQLAAVFVDFLQQVEAAKRQAA